MRQFPETEPSLDKLVLLVLLMVVLFLSPAALWWASVASPWYLVYILWLGVIAVGAWLFERGHKQD